MHPTDVSRTADHEDVRRASEAGFDLRDPPVIESGESRRPAWRRKATLHHAGVEIHARSASLWAARSSAPLSSGTTRLGQNKV